MLLVATLLLLALAHAERVDWTLLDDGTTGGPGFRLGHRAVYCPMLDSMVQFGGFQLNLTDGKYYARGDLHIFDFLNSTGSNSSWFEVYAAASQQPSPRAWFSMSSLVTSATTTCQAIVFGGTSQYNNTLMSPIPAEDYVWLLTVFENRTAIWENIATENIGPQSRFLADSIVRSIDGTLVVFGGTTAANHALRDMWALNLTSRRWNELSPASNLLIEPRYSHSMTYDEETDTMYVYGGRAYDNTTTSERNKHIVYNMAQYSFAQNAWLVNLDIALARAQANLFIVNRTLLSFGGMSAGRTNAFAYNDLLAASLSAEKQCLNFWCSAVDVESRIFPRARFDYAHALRHTNLLVITGGRFAQGMADVWQLNLTAAMQDQNFAVSDGGWFLDPLQLGNLYESMYFLVAVLMFLIVCYWIFAHTVARTFFFSQQQTAAWETQLARARAAAPRGMTPEAIAALPMRKLTTSTEGEMCSICLSEFTLGEHARELPCHHVFHSACVDEWLQNKNSCPLCKQQVDSSVATPPIEGTVVVSNVVPEDGGPRV